MEAAQGSHLCFLDDDDSYAPGALALFREAACAIPAVFRVWVPAPPALPPGTPGPALWSPARLVWAQPEMRPDNISGIAILVPNRPCELGRWEGHQGERGADFTFFSQCCEQMGGPIWRKEVVARVRA